MTFKEIFNELEGLGTEQNRKIYMRHGSGQNTYGVSFANLRKMAKGIGKDQELAVVLWESENVDAQALATLIADPQQLDLKKVELWLENLHYSLLIGLLAGLVAKTKFADIALRKWVTSKKPTTRQCGFSLLTHMLKNGNTINKDDLVDLLSQIKDQIHQSPNQVRAVMNNALIAIGTYYPPLTDRAIKVAQDIGKISVDHGETSCKTPDAVLCIQKAVTHRAAKKS
jgi:3-methyladenine DNA glycosylase AlkD